MGNLTVKKVSAAKEGVLFDGEGLYLRVKNNGAQKSWVLRLTFQRRRIDVGLGSAHLLGLADARDEARRLRKEARLGTDPRRARGVDDLTFRQAAHRVHLELGKSLSNDKARAQWITTIETYALPTLGKRPIKDITRADMLGVLAPIWTTKYETAKRLRQRLTRVFDWAKGAGHYDGENPLSGIQASLPKVKHKPKHHAALPWRDVPAFFKELATREGVSARCLELVILTGVRSGEARGARWAEFDLDADVWVIPAERMKAREEHRVPLTEEAKAVVVQLEGLHKELVFPNRQGNVASDMVFKALLKRMDRDTFTTHGMRSAFRDWADEAAHADRKVAEMVLAHAVGDATERAYARSDLFDRRRDLLEIWAQYVTGKSGNVVKLARG